MPIVVILVIAGACFLTNWITKDRANKIYKQLEDRYNNIEESNSKLREINAGLENSNIRLRDKINGVNTDIKRANIIVGEFEESINGAGNTIERIEITVGFIEDIVRQLPEEIIILEDNGNN